MAEAEFTVDVHALSVGASIRDQIAHRLNLDVLYRASCRESIDAYDAAHGQPCPFRDCKRFMLLGDCLLVVEPLNRTVGAIGRFRLRVTYGPGQQLFTIVAPH